MYYYPYSTPQENKNDNMYYYSYSTPQENSINPEEIINNAKNTKEDLILTLLLSINNTNTITPTIITSTKSNNNINKHNNIKKYVLPSDPTVIENFKKYFKEHYQHSYDYCRDNQYHYIIQFQNNDKIVKQLEHLLKPVEQLIEQKKELLLD